MLFRKVLRDLRQNAVQFWAIYILTTLVLLMGAGFSASDTGFYLSSVEYMTDTNYLDLSVSGSVFHYGDIERLLHTDGIRYVDGIRHATGRTELDEERLLVISYIDGNDVSKLYYVAGEAYSPGAEGVWVEWMFAEPMGLKIGDTLSIKTENVTLEEEIKGFVYAPEYTYYVPNGTYSEPEYGTHGFVYMDIRESPGTDPYYDQLIIDTDKIDCQSKYTDGSTDMLVTTSFLSFAGAVIGTFLVSLAVNIYVTAKVNDIDMVEALKGME